MNITEISAERMPEGYARVRVRTASGLSGYGECASVTADQLARARAIVLGKPAGSHEVHWREMEGLGGLRAAANMALLDIAGKAAGTPVYRLLGGPTRHKARVMTALAGSTDAELIGSLERARGAGYRCFSVPLPPRAGPNAVLRRMEALRAAAPDSDFVLQAAGALTPGQAASLARALERFHLLWLDEPCSLANLEPIRKIAETVTPLGFGGDFPLLLKEGLIDVLRPDLGEHGLSPVRKAAALAETCYVAVAPRHTLGPIATAASLHLAAAIPNFFLAEVPAAARLAVKDGFAELPQGPGLGVS